MVTSEKMRILNNGNVGINQSAPAYTLDVSGTVRITSNLGVGVAPLATAGSINVSDGFYVNGVRQIGPTGPTGPTGPAGSGGGGGSSLYYIPITSGTTITPASGSYGTYYDIQVTTITGLSIGYPTNWSADCPNYWVFRNNTGAYMSLSITYTNSPAVSYPSYLTIPPSSSTTLMATYYGGSSNYVLF